MTKRKRPHKAKATAAAVTLGLAFLWGATTWTKNRAILEYRLLGDRVLVVRKRQAEEWRQGRHDPVRRFPTDSIPVEWSGDGVVIFPPDGPGLERP